MTDNSNEERIRKVYVKDLKAHDALHSVFRAAKKERLSSRAGTPYIALQLVDRTGEVDARVFDNVDAADAAFQAGDYLLLKGKVGHFHGKPQLVIEQLERLDPGPIDPAEFTFVAPPQAEKQERPEKHDKHDKKADRVDGETSHKGSRQRLLKLLDNPEVTGALDVLVRHLEKYVDERIAQRLGGGAPTPTPRHERPDRPERQKKGPRVDHKPAARAEESKPEPKRDPSLPEGLAFKPFSQLVETPPAAAPTETPAAPVTE